MSTLSASGPSPNLPVQDQFITFGIPSLDELLGRPTTALDPTSKGNFGLYLDNCNQSTSICIVGPDGTGKSVLALHLAAQYAAMGNENTRVFYASSDLSFTKTVATWVNFALGLPATRLSEPAKIQPFGRVDYGALNATLRVWLERYLPLIPGDVSFDRRGSDDASPAGRPLPAYLIDKPRRTYTQDGLKEERHYVGFIDLESSTAGDDWGLINRMLATIDVPSANSARHMLIIDAVEGLQAFGGDSDAFGHGRDRRSRIAQVLRAAKEKCHVVFVVEEPRDQERLPEQFVSDAVIRLRVERSHGYARRTVEIEKQRGQGFVRGRHDCLIRRGTGSSTGTHTTCYNPDDKPYNVPGIVPVGANVPPEKPCAKAYFVVVPSLHFLSRELMEAPGAKNADSRLNRNENNSDGFCGTGIPYLDDMLGDQGRRARCVRDAAAVRALDTASDAEGFPWGSISSLIGD